MLAEDLRSTDRETAYDAIITAGKLQRRDLTSTIETFLDSDDPGLREAALKTLGFYLGIQAHRARARVALKADPDIDVRIAAAMALSALASGACEDLSLLVEVALDTAEDEWVRDAAYGAALFVAGISRTEFPIESRVPNFESVADWRLLLQLLERAAASVPPRLRELAALAPDPT
jgi:HEAT repeat protein